MDLTLIFQIIGYVVVGLHAVRAILAAVKVVLNLIPGDQGEALVDKIDSFIAIIENFLGRLVPTTKKK
jgi:hypothetical protein